VIHTPFDGSSKPFTIGLKPLDVSTWLEIDAHHAAYVAEKKRLYTDEREQVLVAEAGTEGAQLEVLELICGHLARQIPCVEPSNDIANSPIAQAALLVQEDLVLMRASPEGWRLVAASVCFPSAWNLREKFGRPMHEIHAPVPGFHAGTRNAGLIDRMFDKLRVEQPVIRWNWSFYGEDKLYFPAPNNQMKRRFGDGPIIGKIFMRLERQTLRKLPKSGDILFTIRIHTNPLEVLAGHPDGKTLATAMAEQVAALTPEEVRYKGLYGEIGRLLARIQDFT
jgi:dimethylamine monooxygenase subunit A